MWLLFALGAGFTDSLRSLFSKKSIQGIDEYFVGWALRFFALILVIPLLYFAEPTTIEPAFWLALVGAGSLNTITTIVFLKALKYADFSKLIPLTAFSPLFAMLVSLIFFGEVPAWIGVVGVVLVVIGSYFLNIKQSREKWYYPLKALVADKGSRYILFCTLSWSIAVNFDKVGVQSSSREFWLVATHVFLVLTLLPIAIYKSRKSFRVFIPHIKKIAPISIFSVLTIFQLFTALPLTLVAYVSATKRMSILFGILWGWLIFKEKNIQERLVAAVIMVIGVILIALS